MIRPSRRSSRITIAGGHVATAVGVLAAVCVAYLFPQPFQAINHRLYDWKLSLAGPPKGPDRVVHVDIDDESLRKYDKEFGSWPWDRSVTAGIIRRLKELGAKTVAFDIIYASQGRTEAGDRELADAVQEVGNVVLAYALTTTDRRGAPIEFGEGAQKRADDLYDFQCWPVKVPATVKLEHARKFEKLLLPQNALIRNARAVGHIKGTLDRDGIHRRLALVIGIADRISPSLGLAALAAYWDLEPHDIRIEPDGTMVLDRVGGPVRIPMDPDGYFPVNWGPWGTFPRYSAADVLEVSGEKSEDDRFRDKLVIVGVTWTGSTDMGATPVSEDMPLSRLHSNVIRTIMSGSYIRTVRWYPYPAGTAILAALLLSVAILKLRLKWGIFLTVAGAVIGFVGTLGAFITAYWEIPIAQAAFIFIAGGLPALTWRAATVELQASRTARAMERYLSPELLAGVITADEDLDLSTKRTELTILFVDIVGFSTISETAEVEHVNRFLNDFFEHMTRAVFDRRGTVDKFLGDGLLAFFGDPVQLENHARSAVEAAVDMQRRMVELNAKWTEAGIREFRNGVSIRIGINTDFVVVGNVGSERRMEYTVVGSAVNVASRLQSLAHPGGIVFTARTRALAKPDFNVTGPEQVKVKGIDKSIEVYRIDDVANGPS